MRSDYQNRYEQWERPRTEYTGQLNEMPELSQVSFEMWHFVLDRVSLSEDWNHHGEVASEEVVRESLPEISL